MLASMPTQTGVKTYFRTTTAVRLKKTAGTTQAVRRRMYVQSTAAVEGSLVRHVAMTGSTTSIGP